MKDINVFTVTGRLTRDADLKHTSSGFSICSFSIAYNRSQKSGDTWEDKACFIECTIFAKRGEVLAPMLQKGKQVTLSGELDHQRWEGQDGKVHSKHVLVVEGIIIASSGKKENQPVQEEQVEQGNATGEYDDIPF